MKRLAGALAAAAALAGLLSGCSSGTSTRLATGASARPTARLSTQPSAAPVPAPRQARYATTVLVDRPLGLWTLADVGGAVLGDAVVDSSPAMRDGRVTGGRIATTTGPLGALAARFTGQGRVVTPLRGVLQPGRPFTLEFLFRPDDCTRHWTQVLGTAAYTALGRQGVNVLHYPRSFPTGCHLAVEFWKNDVFTGGCGPAAVPRTGDWLHFAVTYDGRSARCYAAGRLVGTTPVRGFGTSPTSSFGIGGAGSGYAGTLDSGSLADVAVYDRALPAAAVLHHAAVAAH